MGFRRVILLNKRKAVLFVICESQKRASAKWDRENMIVGAKVRKEFAAEFKAACKAAGTSPNAVIKKAMADFIKSHRAAGME
mgnify:CR=1 FL=1